MCCRDHARVSEMLEVMSRADRLQKCGSLKRTHSSPRSPPCDGIEFDRVNVIAPSGKLLARDLTFQVLCPVPLSSLPVCPPKAHTTPLASHQCTL